MEMEQFAPGPTFCIYKVFIAVRGRMEFDEITHKMLLKYHVLTQV